MSDQTTPPESVADCEDPAIKGQIEEGSKAYYAKDYAKAKCVSDWAQADFLVGPSIFSEGCLPTSKRKKIGMPYGT